MDDQRPNVISAAGHVARDVSALLTAEKDLLGAELRESRDRLVSLAVMGVIAAVVALFAVGFVLMAATVWLVVAGLPVSWAVTAVAGFLVLMALVFGLAAARKARNLSLVPEKTINQVVSDFEFIRRRFHG